MDFAIDRLKYLLHNMVSSLKDFATISDDFRLLLQFFADDEVVEFTPDLKELFDCRVSLSPKQKEALLQLLNTMKN